MMLAIITNPGQLARYIGGSVMCDHRPPMDLLRFSHKIISAGNAFAPSKALSVGRLDYDADHSSELHLFNETSSEDNESLASYPPAGLLCANLDILSHHIHTMLDMVTNP